MSAWGAVPDDLRITFPPLWTPTATELAAIAKQKAGIRPDEQVHLERFEVVRHTAGGEPRRS